jgi:hypothetical protein
MRRLLHTKEIIDSYLLANRGKGSGGSSDSEESKALHDVILLF